VADKSPLSTAALEQRRSAGFQRGQSGNPRGRRPGTPNRVTVEVRAAAAEIVDSPEYRARLKAQAIAGELPPQIEAMLWHYAKGKPRDVLQLEATLATAGPDLSGESNAQLAERVKKLPAELEG